MRKTRWISGILSLLMVGCTGGGGNYVPPVGTAPPSTTGSTVTLDLGTTTVVPDSRAAVAHPSKLTLREMSGGSITVMGQDAVTSAGISTAVPGSATIGRFYLSETELTRDQWIALVVAAGVSVSREPWVAADAAAGLTTLAGGSRPATGLSYEMVTDVVAAWNAKSVFRLRLPTGSEWEAACRAGSTTPWSWGDSQSMSTVGTYAVVSGTALAAGPSAVATARANAFGFYDMHGNAWEWVSAGGAAREASLSGGSWSDHPISSRSGNVLPLSTQVAYPLAGVRLALEVQ